MELLNQVDYRNLLAPLGRVTINNLFARFVIEQRVEGQIWVDDAVAPKTFYVIHPYGMTLLFGDCTNEKFNSRFRDYCLNTAKSRTQVEWMQAFPNSWTAVLRELFQGKLVPPSPQTAKLETGIIELNTRINFRFNESKYRARTNDLQAALIRIEEVNARIFDDMKGSVVPSNFWRTKDDFLNFGTGFGLYYNDQLAATAFSSFVHKNQLELGIETMAKFRGHGFARQVCSALIDYCLAKNLEPVWACRLENTGSYQLALSLGFEPALEIPYYRLSN
jgi:GNAT superfamily N-acetyltransferase